MHANVVGFQGTFKHMADGAAHCELGDLRADYPSESMVRDNVNLPLYTSMTLKIVLISPVIQKLLDLLYNVRLDLL